MEFNERQSIHEPGPQFYMPTAQERKEGGWDVSPRHLPDGTQYLTVEYYLKPLRILEGDGPSACFWIVPGTVTNDQPPILWVI